ncbi:MAG: glycoside hydrolase family 68 protein [Microbacterium sp.]|nr:glycoside hydrolase family 68 protein [Microbacterium sp.]
MTFSLPDSWVWDFWTAVDGDTIHLFYLHAPMALGDPDLRHRNASIGHATSTDGVAWVDHGVVLTHGSPGSPDASATWTGSVLRDPSGTWRMFYTGARFAAPGDRTNVETILMATSADLFTWVKDPGVAVSAAHPWYETLADGTWHEEAWRDPWIVRDPGGQGWHMLMTARARDIPADVDPLDRGVVGHAVSDDLVHWTLAAPLSAPGAGFAHLEVPQLTRIDDRSVLLFSCDSAHLAGDRRGSEGGIWALPVDPDELLAGTAEVRAAHRITGDELYAGRIVRTPDGPALLGFENTGTGGAFIGRLADPRPVHWDGRGRLVVAQQEVAS